MSLSESLSQFDKVVRGLESRAGVLPVNAAARIESAGTVYLLAPSSFLGQSFTATLARCLLGAGKRVALVDDTISVMPPGLEDCILLKTGAFRRERPVAGLAINLANTPFVHGFFVAAAADACIATVDILAVLDAFDFPVIYQSASVMRLATLARLDDYVALSRQLDDSLSVQTLAALLEMRINIDRSAMLPVLCSLEDEYFSPYPAGKDVTFELGSEEIFCDIGAHVGTTIRKFLTASRWKYSAIHAFEPDTGNFKALNEGVFERLSNFYPKNIALSDRRSMLGFAETGTMGSRLDIGGNVEVQASTLDDEVPHATFIKMDVEGHETKILAGARRLISQSKPRLSITGYHYADDLLEIAHLLREIEPGYRLRVRHHSFYYYDTILYADTPS